MRRQLKSESNIPRRIVRLLGVTAISVAIAMILLAVSMARSVDDLSDEFYQQMVQSSLDSQIDHLCLLTETESSWGAAVSWILAGDTERIYQNIGKSTTESHNYDYAYIYGGDDQLLYAFEQNGEGSDLSIPQPEIAGRLLSRIRRMPLEPQAVTAGFFILDGKVAAVAAARFRPESPEEIIDGEIPVLMNVVILGDGVLGHMAAALMLPKLTVALVDDHLPNSVSVPLSGTSERAHFTWEQPKTGNELLTRSLGAIAIICALTMFGHLVVGRITMRLAQAFLRESHEARNDRLTGLLNRAGFEEEVESKRIKRAMDTNRVALILIDMDRFKTINDTYGHAAGDVALQMMAKRLRAAVRQEDITARMGGDEFLVLIVDDDPTAIVKLVTRRLEEAARHPVIIDDGVEVLVQGSMGTAIAKSGIEMRELMMTADRAMYEAKTTTAFLEDGQSNDAKIHGKKTELTSTNIDHSITAKSA